MRVLLEYLQGERERRWTVPPLTTRRAVFIHEPSRTVSERNEEGKLRLRGIRENS